MTDQQIAKYLSGESSENEKQELEKWMMDNPNNKKEFKKMEEIWETTEKSNYKPDVEKALKSISDRLPEQKPAQRSAMFYIIRVAAVFIIGLGLFGIFHSPSKIITVATLDKQEPLDLELPDGSHITLNMNSSIQYPKKFDKKERKVHFTGEGYFKIAKNPEKPFIIESGNIITKVLGTQFNLTTNHSDSIVKITVTEGLVSFNLKQEEKLKEVFVKAGEVGEIDVQKGVITQKVNEELNYMAWKNGILTYQNTPFATAIKEISSFYNKKIIVADSNLNNEPLQAYFDSLPFETILNELELLMDVEIVTSENTVYIHEKL